MKDKSPKCRHNEIMNRLIDQGFEADAASLKATIIMDDVTEMQKPDRYIPIVSDDGDWKKLQGMLNISKDIQKAALRIMRRSKKRSFKPADVLAIVRRNNETFRAIHKEWAINAVQYAKCNHELNLRGEITKAEADRRSTSCVWYNNCDGLDVDFKRNVINVMYPIGSGTLSIPVKNFKKRDSLRNIKLERDGLTNEGLEITYHHQDDSIDKMMAAAVGATKKKEVLASEQRDLLDILVTLEREEVSK